MTSDDEDATVASENIIVIQRTLAKFIQDSSSWPVTQVTPNFLLDGLRSLNGDQPSSFRLSPGMYETGVIENTVSCLIAGAPFRNNTTTTTVDGAGDHTCAKRISQSDMAIFQKPIRINSCASLVIHGIWFTNRVEVIGKGPVYFSQCLFGATAWSSDVLASSSLSTSRFSSVRVAVEGECSFFYCDFDNICGMAGSVGVNEVPVITACGCTKLTICNSSFCGPDVVSTVLVLLDSSRLEADSISVVRCGGHGLVVQDESCAVIFRSVFGHNGNGVWVRDRGNLEIWDSSIEAVYRGKCGLFLSNHGRCVAKYCSFSAWAARPYSVGSTIVTARDHAHVSLSVCELFWKESEAADERQQKHKGREEMIHPGFPFSVLPTDFEKAEDFGFCHVLLKGRSEATLTRCVLRMPIVEEPNAEFAAVGVFLQSVSQISSLSLYAVENTLVYEYPKGSGVETSDNKGSNLGSALPLMFGLVLPCILDDEEEKNLGQLATMWVLTNQFIENNEQTLRDASLVCCSYSTYSELTGKLPFASFDNTSESVDAVSDSFSTTAAVSEKGDFYGSNNNSNYKNGSINDKEGNFDAIMKDGIAAVSRNGASSIPVNEKLGSTLLTLDGKPWTSLDPSIKGASTALGVAGTTGATSSSFFGISRDDKSDSTSLTSFSEEGEEEEEGEACGNGICTVAGEDSEMPFGASNSSQPTHSFSGHTEPFLQNSSLPEQNVQGAFGSATGQFNVALGKAIAQPSNVTLKVSSRLCTPVSAKTSTESASRRVSIDTDVKGSVCQLPSKKQTQYISLATAEKHASRYKSGLKKKPAVESQAKAVKRVDSKRNALLVHHQNENNGVRLQTGHSRPATAKTVFCSGSDSYPHNAKLASSSRWFLMSTSDSDNGGQSLAQSRETNSDLSKEVWPWEVTALRGLLGKKLGLYSSFEAHNRAFCVPTGKEEERVEEQPYRRRLPRSRVDVEPLIAGIRERCIFPPKHATRSQPPWTAPPNGFTPRVCSSSRERAGLASLRLYRDFWEKWHKTHLFSELLNELRHDQRQRERLTVDEMKSQANRMHTLGFKERGSGVEGGNAAGSAHNYALQRRAVGQCRRNNKSPMEFKENETDITFSQRYGSGSTNETRKPNERTLRRGASSSGQRVQIPRPPAPVRASDERSKMLYKGRHVQSSNSTV